MPTITRTQVRQEMLRRAPLLGRALTADSVTKAGPAINDISEYERQRSGITAFENQYIHRYNLADNDRWRLATVLDSGATNGVLNVDGPAYTDGTDVAYERLTVHPDDLNFAIAESQRRQRVKTNIALVRGHDLDMEMVGTNYWGTAVALGGSSQSNVTLTKATSPAAEVFSGTQVLTFAGTGASPTVLSEFIDVGASRNVFAAVLVRVVTPPFTFSLYDTTNAVVFGTPVTLSTQQAPTFGGGGWYVLYLQAQVPAGCNIMQLMFSSTSASALAEIDTCFGPYQSGQTEYLLQTAIDEAYKLRFVRPSVFVAPTQTSGIASADSLSYMGDLVRPDDWDIEAFRRDVNFNRLRFQANSYNNSNVGWTWRRGQGGYNIPGGNMFMQNGMRPVWLAMEAQVSAFEPLLTETSTTNQPLDECACYSLRYLAETMSQRDPTNSVWQNMLQEYKMWSVIEDQGRPPQAMYLPQRYHAIRA